MTRNEWKTRGKRVARATVAALVSLWVLYVVAINVFLSTSLFDRVVNRDPVTLDVHFEHGWSLWPTRIHAKRLAIRSSDSNVMWRLELDEVTFDVALRDLPRRRLTVERARGRGVGMRIQTKRTTYPDDADEIRDLPPIEGFPAFAVRPAGPHHPELWDDDQYRLITVSLDDVSAEDVREIWIDGHRFAGHASVAGRFYLKPLRAVAVGPVRVEIRSGEVQRGRGEPLVRDLGGRLEVTASRFDPREVEENEALRFFEVTTKLRGRSIPLARLADAPFSSAYVDGVVDARDLTLRIDRGRLADGSTAEIVVEELHVARGGYLADGALALHASVVAGRLRARTEPARWSVVRADGAAVLEVGHGSASLDTADLDLAAAPFRDLHLTVEADDARAPSAWILPGLDDGAVTFALHAETYAAFGAEERGAFVVDKGPLAMGIRLGKDGAHPHFFGLQDWLGEEERKAKALPRAVSGRPTK